MPDLIILRIIPDEPMSGADFTDYLSDLEITAFDLTFADSVQGVAIGSAGELADPHIPNPPNPVPAPHTVNLNNTGVIQHYVDIPIPDPNNPPPATVVARRLEAVATAIIEVNAPAGHPEYPTGSHFDLRLEVGRGGLDVVYRTLHYNVEVTTVGALPSDQTACFAMAASAYITLPRAAVGLDSTLGYVDLPANGEPPNFTQLVNAIDAVLAKDPSGVNSTLNDLTPLTPAQSRQVANEIIWNRELYPLPEEPRPLGQMYTSPPVDPAVDADDAERDRMQFEAEVGGYQATHEAEATRLTGFVFAAAAAVRCEQLSEAASQAGLTFPIITSAGTPTTVPQASILLTDSPSLTPAFTVPAAYYYALGATLPPQVSAEQRYDMARLQTEERLLAEFRVAVDAAVINVPAAPVVAGGAAQGANQAARRLKALGSTRGPLADVELDPPVSALVQDWLDHVGPTARIVGDFWTAEVGAGGEPAAYLELLLHVITDNHQDLIDAIKAAVPGLAVSDADELVAVTDQEWRDFFLGPPAQTALLPPSTLPGTPAERTEAFIRKLRQFFAVRYAGAAAGAPTVGAPPTLGLPIRDVIAAFIDAYDAQGTGTFAFGAAWNDAALGTAIMAVFPDDPAAQAWLRQALDTINSLFGMTDVGDSELHFSLMEALYARGFTNEASVQELSLADFQVALTGTIAYPYAPAIYGNAGGTNPETAPGEESFVPVNPDGSLVDCVPPPHLSPFGPVQYLHEMLHLSAESTCEVPFPACEEPFPESRATLGRLLAERRRPLGDLHVTRANLSTPLPMIDLVNESLESLASGLPALTGGVVYDTAGDELAGHSLNTPGSPLASPPEPFAHDPQTLFAAIPEHSSPATPVELPGAYEKLRTDFSAPELPYAQALDINRSYLEHMGTSRYATMRRFREEITEFAIDPTNQPADFQTHLWRYPVRLEIAREYLRISVQEYELLYDQDVADAPAAGRLALSELYGFPSGQVDWEVEITEVSQFIDRTGLTYCEFLDLWRSEFVVFERAGPDQEFPECQPCCPDNLQIRFTDPADPMVALRKLAVFIRLWRRLQELPGPKVSFNELRDIADVLALFDGSDSINPDFIRQLAALFMLRDYLDLPLSDASQPPGGTGADRTHLLSLWVGPNANAWNWAVQLVLDRIDDYVDAHQRPRRGPEFIRIIAANLKTLSRLTGFDPDSPGDRWHDKPTSTLRFVEVLTKIYSSEFTVGEIVFLFTAEDHLQGDDPFALGALNESLDDPLDLPDEDRAHSLWVLRGKLLRVEVDDDEAHAWTWPRIETALRQEFGLKPLAGMPDPLHDLGEHFFPSVLEQSGHPVDIASRQYRVALAEADTSPLLWNTPPNGPLRYDAGHLRFQLPLKDEALNDELAGARKLEPVEQEAVRDLYFAARATLAPFAAIFDNFGEAVDRLVQAEDEGERWALFQAEFARFYRRCNVISEHLAEHVSTATDHADFEGPAVAWQVVKRLWADENLAKIPWEDDSGRPPDVTWMPQPSGSAFAALLGLTGTGILGEFETAGNVVWREMRGPFSAFGKTRNAWNSPVPTIIPAIDLALGQDQQNFVDTRNGFALRASNGEPLGGAQPFAVRWHGALLIEQDGAYTFLAGAPTPNGEEPNFDACKDHRWRVMLRRGQKTWILLNYRSTGEEAPNSCSEPLTLRRGAYELIVEFEQTEPLFDRAEDICPRESGFQVKYRGPDSDDVAVAIPKTRLFLITKDGALGEGIDQGTNAARFLADQFASTLRDVRRTYQRAFKALLFAHRFRLSAQLAPGDYVSELSYMFDHAGAFVGTSYFREPAQFSTHRAHFDLNLLPVADPYLPPAEAQDQRVQPSAKRQAALFDWWERFFDYCLMRKETQEAIERPAWLVFYEAAQRQPDDPAQLLRHIGVDLRHAPLVLKYFNSYEIQAPDLEDERWVVRAWQGEKWLRELERHFHPLSTTEARPELWASDEPGEPASGNANLTRFVQDGYFENGEPRRYQDLTNLNDALRLRARGALLAYLCALNRVLLPWGGGEHAAEPRDLSEFLLQDVEVGICERASRIEEAISAVHAFVQRARLGLEPSFVPTQQFVQLWDSRFATFRTWELCKRREVYTENWIDWRELEKARRSEAFLFLEDRLRRANLTVPVPGGLEWWPDQKPPAHPSLTALQASEPSWIELFDPEPEPEGLNVLGSPERNGRLSWLAPVGGIPVPSPDDDDDENDDIAVDLRNIRPAYVARRDRRLGGPFADLEALPLWIQAPIRLGTRFVRVAAAGVPPASTSFVPRSEGEPIQCCDDCGEPHGPVIDEYYFWLQDARHYDQADATQNADEGADAPDNPENDTTSDWHRPEELPGLLHWSSKDMVHLHWSRLHNGRFMQLRRSDEGLTVELRPGEAAELDFKGRTADSLRFEVNGGVGQEGHLDPALPGFRYDMVTDAATVLPQVVPPDPPTASFPDPLSAYPYFVYFEPGAPLLPSTFSVALTVAGVLRGHCRFEAALKWYDLAAPPLRRDNTWRQCPEPEEPPPVEDGPDDENGEPREGRDPDATLYARRESAPPLADTEAPERDELDHVEPCCPTSPVDDQEARERAIMLQYLETLLQWSDALVCRNTPEAFQQATVTLNAIGRILGERPDTIYSGDAEETQPLSCFTARPAPLNPRLLSLYDRTADRLALIHHCINGHRLVNGVPNVDMPFWGNSGLRDGWLTTTSACEDPDCLSCCTPYRFSVLVRNALELASVVRTLGAELLAAYEKGDAEFLASLRATHERQLLQLALEARQNQWREADWQVQALEKAKQGAQTRQRYYDALLRNGLNAGESGYEALLGVSMASRAAGNVSEAIAQGMGMVPDFWFGVAGMMGTPLQFQQLPVGNKLAAGFATAARILNALADIAGTGASLSLTEGGWDRREQEWRHQVEIIGIEIEQIERQLLAADRRRDIALRELNSHQRQLEHSMELQDFLRDKFTNHELYLHLQKETSALHYQAYELALHAAREAQRAFNFELGHRSSNFLPREAWDDLREGLLAGERLELAVRQMERSHLDTNCREYEITKHISLRLHFPLAFLALQTTGYCEIEVPEWMFDLDYPGHYMRRIKNVRITAPAVVGPYTGVHCRMTLLSSVTRVDPRLVEPPEPCCETDELHDGYQPLPDDTRIVRLYAATEAIATSNAQNDPGLFELSFRDERYLPFEYSGAVSRWRIELPPENNQFDLASLSDLVVHLSYTAREGGEVLRTVANSAAQKRAPGAGLRLFDFQHDFPDAWHRFQRPDRTSPSLLTLSIGREHFPFLTGDRVPQITRLELFFEVSDPHKRADQVVHLVTKHIVAHGPEEDCHCGGYDIHCVASAEWPGLYHGVLELELPTLSGKAHELGTFRFPRSAGRLREAFLLCGYAAAEERGDRRFPRQRKREPIQMQPTTYLPTP
jgi:hypothetical protein